MYNLCKSKEIIFFEIKRRIYSILVNNFGNYLTYGYILPECVSIFLTFRCDLSCKYCIHKDNSSEYRKFFKDISVEITLDDWRKILKDILRFAKIIDITGAEPLLYDGWEKIAEFIKENNAFVHIQTNGVKINQYLNEILKNCNRIQISLDGIGNINDRIRGDGVFQEVIDGLINLDRLKKENKQITPLVDINFTIQKENIDTISEFCEYFNKTDIDIESITLRHPFYSKNLPDEKFEKISSLSENYSSFRKMHTPLREEFDEDILKKEIRKIKTRKYRFNIYFFPDISFKKIKKFYSGEILYKSKRCIYPWTDMFVFSNGDVGICSNFFVGNAIQNNIIELFRNERARTFRKYLWRERNFSLCSVCDNFY